MGRVTYLHHYLPTLWFAVIMSGFCLDHFVFTSRRFSHRAKTVVFCLVAGSVCFAGFWLRACAWGIDGPIDKYKWRVFRKVRVSLPLEAKRRLNGERSRGTSCTSIRSIEGCHMHRIASSCHDSTRVGGDTTAMQASGLVQMPQ